MVFSKKFFKSKPKVAKEAVSVKIESDSLKMVVGKSVQNKILISNFGYKNIAAKSKVMAKS